MYFNYFFTVLSVPLKSQTVTQAVLTIKTHLGSSCYICSVKAEIQLSPSENTKIIIES